MPLKEEIVYQYDGTLDGMLCCIFASYEYHELPASIFGPDEQQTTLFLTRLIPSDPEKADRVLKGLYRKAGTEAAELVQLCHLTCLPDKERHALGFVRLAMKLGRTACSLLTAPHVCQINQAVRFLQTEAHHLCGFIRFTEVDRTLVSMITPKNNVLPLLDSHFSDRFPEERFIIYDRTRRLALMHLPGSSKIVPLRELKLPALSAHELDIQMLWRRFHETIAIEGRINTSLQQNNLPLRFRPDMTEFQDQRRPSESFSLSSPKGVLPQ